MIDTLKSAFEVELQLLAFLATDVELQQHYLTHLADNQAQQIRQLLAVAAQWDRILALWDFLADRCRKQKQAITENEQQLLTHGVEIHNLIWKNKTASFVSPPINTRYDYEQHQQGPMTGDTIIEVWLEGLKNTAGNLQKKPLVKTQ